MSGSAQHAASLQCLWAGDGTLATACNESMVRVWDLQRDGAALHPPERSHRCSRRSSRLRCRAWRCRELHALAARPRDPAQVAVGACRLSARGCADRPRAPLLRRHPLGAELCGGGRAQDVITKIVYHKQRGTLAAATKDGLVVFWRYVGASPGDEDPSSAWAVMTSASLDAKVDHLVWGPRPSLLGAGFSESASVLLESTLYRAVREGVGCIQSGPGKVSHGLQLQSLWIIPAAAVS